MPRREPWRDVDHLLYVKVGTGPVLLLLHGTTWETKRWPESYWIGLAQRATAAGVEPVLRWHGEQEREEKGFHYWIVPSQATPEPVPLATRNIR